MGACVNTNILKTTFYNNCYSESFEALECVLVSIYCSKYYLICDNIRPTLIGKHANKCVKRFIVH